MMKRTVVTLLLAFTTATAALGVAEVFLRVFELAPTAGLATVTADEFASIPGILAPNQQLLDLRNRNLPHRTSVNELGYRGDPVSRSKPVGEFRVLMVGDSFIYGDFVNDSETLPARLESELALACPGVRVVNVGLPGSTITEHRELISRGLALAPDLVVLGFSENDVTDLAQSNMWLDLERNRTAKSGFPVKYIYPIVRRTALFNLMMAARGRWRTIPASAEIAEPSRERAQHSASPDSAERVRYSQVLQGISDDLRRASVPLAFTSFPLHVTLYGLRSTEQLEWVHATAASLGIPVIETLPALRADGRGDTELFLLPHDGHPSAAGYQVAAHVIARALASMQMLPETCAPMSAP